MFRNIKKKKIRRSYCKKKEPTTRFPRSMRTRKFKVSSCISKKEGNKGKNNETYIPKTKKAGGGFLNRYDFAYAVRDVVNHYHRHFFTAL